MSWRKPRLPRGIFKNEPLPTWTSEDSETGHNVIEFQKRYKDWLFIKGFPRRVFFSLTPAFLIVGVISFANHLGERAFWIMVYPLGLPTYLLVLVQLAVFVFLFKAAERRRLITQRGFESPTEEEIRNYRKNMRKWLIAGHSTGYHV